MMRKKWDNGANFFILYCIGKNVYFWKNGLARVLGSPPPFFDAFSYKHDFAILLLITKTTNSHTANMANSKHLTG